VLNVCAPQALSLTSTLQCTTSPRRT
jgi:hypothetical protein